MKKVLSLILMLSIMSICFSIGSAAEQVDDERFFYADGIEIVIESDDFTYEEKKIIVDYIVYGDDAISPYGLACIFGHSLKTAYAEEIHHNAYSSSPMCLVNRYKVTTCTRSSCDYINKEFLDSYRTSACHG